MQPVTKAEPRADLFIGAFAAGVADTYITSYREVMRELHEQNGMSLLLTIVNTLLARMATDNTDAYHTSVAMMHEMASVRSRYFVMAAAVDVAYNQRKAGDVVKSLPSAEETLSIALR